MDKVISSNIAERVPQNEVSLDDGSVWYLPHHGVYHPKKPSKIRVVFDCSAEYKGEVLNRHLLQGPDLTNSLIGILCRFRKERVAFTCDIEGMFHQVGMPEKCRNFLRFLWWQDGELNKPPMEYRMRAHPFGACSSPGCANFTLKHTADCFRETCGNDAAHFLQKNFYVDDGLVSTETKEEAISLIHASKQLCEKGGFRLHKFVTNDKTILESIPVSDRAKNSANISILQEDLSIERTLGVQWCVENDELKFRVQLADKPLNRRGILSTVSSIFDPLGLVAPVLLTGKRILQGLCRDGHGWDDPVPEATRVEWEKWRTDVQNLSTLNIPRCYKPQNFGTVKCAELHHFSDACLTGYGQSSYLRLVDHNDQVSSTLVMAKSRVTPSKPITVPRLELTAATVSVKVSSFLCKELEYNEVRQFFYTDSKVVLGYISNTSKRFHIFVANRVQKIRDYTAPENWRYIETDQNPADIASRGLTAQELVESKLWWKGPRFLSTTDTPPCLESIELSPEDPEVKRTEVFSLSTNVKTVPQALLQERLKYFSSWNKAKRAVAVCVRYKAILKERALNKSKSRVKVRNKSSMRHYIPVSVSEIEEAGRIILKDVQAQAFHSEMAALKRMPATVSKTSPLHSLDPFLDSNDILRVGGRIRRAKLPLDVAHPIVLPKSSHVTSLVASHYHIVSGHSGRGMTLNAIRQAGFWILGARRTAAKLVMQCVTCRRLRGTPRMQKMADLPEERLDVAPPFTYSAVDYFGPFYIKEGRKELKRWGVLFTCLSSRAIHIETANALTADSFLNAYRRFICRRGPIRELRSDRGTNFIGGKSELVAALKEMDQDKVSRELLKDNCDFIKFNMNVPHASHMGGVWERMIRCVRNALNFLLHSHAQRLDDELLRTLMTEAEAIVNSRPLTYIDTVSPDSLQPLTPSQILTLKSSAVLPPPGKFVQQDLYCRKRWRCVQFLANEFWSRWRKEFLTHQQERKKWTRQQPNLKKDDVVLMCDDSLPRIQWPLARIIETFEGQDGLVRKVKVKLCDGSVYERPVHKLVVLLDQGTSSEDPAC